MMSSDSSAVAGGLARHIPVLARRAMTWLGVRNGGVYVDATFGAGGYARAILATPGARVIGIDRDDTAIAAGAALVEDARGRLTLVEGRFSELDTIAAAHGAAGVDGVVFDLGVSSMQIDEPSRGFSFRLDGPLDMRMGRGGPSAADVVARASERDLAFIIATLGEERHARAIARAIVKTRAARPIVTTRALADIVARIVHSKEGAIHPATRTFQALRIFGQRRAGRIGARPRRRRARTQAGGAPCRRRLSFARGSHRQDLPRRTQPRAGILSPSAADDRGAADLPRADAAAGNAGRSRDRRQPAGAIGEAPRRRTHRCRRGLSGKRNAAAAAAFARGHHAGARMILRILNLVVIVALVAAAAYVYRIKFDSTVQAERLAKIRSEVRRERDTIAALRAEWGELDNPARIEALAKRYLQLKPVTPTQFNSLDQLPDRPPQFIKSDSQDPIGVMIENLEEPDTVTGSIAAPASAPAEPASETGAQAPANPDR